MDATQLKYFRTVCREGSYAKAAEKLFISPQGLSKAMHKLEDELGVPLFESTGAGPALTDYGKALLGCTAAYLREHQRILNEIKTLRQNADKQITIGIKAGFSDGLGKNFLSDFIIQNPDLSIHLRSFPNATLAEAMREPDRTVWILPGAYDTAVFESIYERREKLFLIVGKTHPLASRERISVKDIAGYPLVALPHDIGQKHTVDKAFSDHLMAAPDYLLDIADRDFTMRLIQSGCAISFNSGWEYKRYEGIRRIDFCDLDVTVSANVLVRRDACETTALRRFRDYIRKKESSADLLG